jgi:hypothetical protein
MGKNYDDELLFTEKEMIEYEIQSIQLVSENTWAPKLLITLMDGKQMSSNININLVHDLRMMGVDARPHLKDTVKREIAYMRGYREGMEAFPKRKVKRVYSELDPYGEELWEE